MEQQIRLTDIFYNFSTADQILAGYSGEVGPGKVTIAGFILVPVRQICTGGEGQIVSIDTMEACEVRDLSHYIALEEVVPFSRYQPSDSIH